MELLSAEPGAAELPFVEPDVVELEFVAPAFASWLPLPVERDWPASSQVPWAQSAGVVASTT
jgi:hypothetical protein